jgi:hypothetical protein
VVTERDITTVFRLDSSAIVPNADDHRCWAVAAAVDAFHAPSPVETHVETVPGAIVVVKCWKSTQKPITKEFYYNYELLASLLRSRKLRVSDRHVSPLSLVNEPLTPGSSNTLLRFMMVLLPNNATHHAIAMLEYDPPSLQ